MTVQNTIRYPDRRSPEVMGRRAWWLVGLSILIPGSAQLLAGNRRGGRFAVGATFVSWALGALALAVSTLARPVFLSIVTNPLALLAAQVVLVFYGALWLVLFLDTLRLVRLVNLRGVTRVAVPALAVVALVAGDAISGEAFWRSGACPGEALAKPDCCVR